MSIFNFNIQHHADDATDAVERFKKHGDLDQCMREVAIAVDPIRIDKAMLLNHVTKLCMANNPDRAIKLINAMGPTDLRVWWLVTRVIIALLWKWGWRAAFVGAVVWAVLYFAGVV